MRYQALTRRGQHANRIPIITSLLLALLCGVTVAGCSATGSTSGGAVQAPPTITPPPITNGAPVHQILAGTGIAAIRPHLSGVPTYTADDMKQFIDKSTIVGPDHTASPPTVLIADFFGCADIERHSGGQISPGLSGCGKGTHYGFVLEAGAFAFAGPSGGPHVAASRIFLLFDPVSGNLLMYGSALEQAVTTTPTPQPSKSTPTETSVPHVMLTLKPTSAEQTCQSSSTVLPATKLTLDNTGSNVAVSWTAAIGEKIGTSGTIWASISPSSGSIPAGQTVQITLTPASNICSLSQSVVPDATYHVVIHYGSRQQLTFSDLVHSPIPG